MNPYTSPWSISQPSYASSSCQLAAPTQNSPNINNSWKSNLLPTFGSLTDFKFCLSFRNLTQATFNYSCLHKMLVSYPKPATLLTLNLQTSQ